MRHETNRPSDAPVDAAGPPFTTRIDDTETVTEAVVRSVAVVTNVEPLEVAPLGEDLDAAALNELFDRPDAGHRLSFTFGDCRVTVEGRNRVRVRSIDELDG